MSNGESPNTPPQPSAGPEIHPAITFWQKEWRVITSAAFWIALVILGVGIFYVSERHYAGVIDEQDKKIQRVESERDGYRNQLQEEKERLAQSPNSGGDTKPAPPTKQEIAMLASHLIDISCHWDPRSDMYSTLKDDANELFREKTFKVWQYIFERGEFSQRLFNNMHGENRKGPFELWASNQVCEIGCDFRKYADQMK